MVMMTGSLGVRGTVVWLTPQQGGRASGPPAPDYDYDYTATAYLPPRTAEDGQAGIALSRFAPGAWRSPAEGVLVPGRDHRAQQVVPGGIVVVTEGLRPVGLFTVEEVLAPAGDGAAATETAPVTGVPDQQPDAQAAREVAADAPYRHTTAATRWTTPETAGTH